MVHLERRDRGIMCFVIFLFAFQFIAISYVSANISGWSQVTVIDYNPADRMATPGYLKSRITNATATYEVTQTLTFVNSTQTVIVASIDMATCPSPTGAGFKVNMNSSFLADTDLVKTVLSWTYVGAGNLTGFVIATSTPTYQSMWDMLATTDPDNNGTVTITWEAFQVQKLKAATQMLVWVEFDDASYLPADTDYLELSIKYYAGTLLLTQTQILQGLAGSIGALWFIVGAAVSPFWNPQRRRKGQR